MNREHLYAETPGDVTGTGASAQAVILSGTGSAGTWFFIATAASNQALMNTYDVKLDTAALGAAGAADHYISPKDITDYFSCPLIFVATPVSAGAGNIYAELDLFNDLTGLGNDYHIKQSSIMALLKHAYDQYATDNGAGANTSNTAAYDDILTLTLPVDAITDNYLIIACTSCKKDTTASSFNVKLVINGTDYADATMRAVNTAYYQPFFDHAVVALSAGQTVKIQGKVTTGGTASFLFSTILAFPLSTFPWYKSVASRTEVTTTSSTYREVPTDDTPILSDLLQAKPIWLLSSCLGRRGASTTSHLQRTTLDSTTLQETSNEPPVANAENCHFAQSVFTPSAGYHEVYTATKTDGVGITVAGKSEAVVTLVQLSDDRTVSLPGSISLLGNASIL